MPWSRSARLLLLFGALVCAGCAAWVRAEPEELARWRAQASELRGLPFTGRVPLRWVAREELPELVRAELADLIADGYATAYRDAVAALGLVPPELDLIELQVRLNQDQLAGFYSVRERTMYVLGGPDRPDEPIVIHELVHALQHQHFAGTLELMQGLRRNDDVVLALGAAAEGDAMLVMLLYRLGGGELARDSAELLRAGLREDLERPSGLLAEVPRIVRTSLLFPYAHGFDLAERAFRAGGTAALDRLLRDAPLSALRVRRPEADHDVEFLRLPAERAAALAGAGCRAGHDNVAGAVGIDTLLADHGAPGSAPTERWSGDRYLRVDCPAGTELLWITRWTTPGAAAEFARAYAEIAEGVAQVAPLAGVPRARASGRSALVATPGLFARGDELLSATEMRAYPGLAAWIADRCFPESPCPAHSLPGSR